MAGCKQPWRSTEVGKHREVRMPAADLPHLRFDQLALEPEEGATKPDAVTGRARFQIDLRGGKERRILPDRRQELRFSPDRRSGQDRRPRRSWEPGSNL